MPHRMPALVFSLMVEGDEMRIEKLFHAAIVRDEPVHTALNL